MRNIKICKQCKCSKLIKFKKNKRFSIFVKQYFAKGNKELSICSFNQDIKDDILGTIPKKCFYEFEQKIIK